MYSAQLKVYSTHQKIERIKENEVVNYSARSKRHYKRNKLCKGVWGMPRLSEAKKDVISCEKLRGLAHTNRSADVRMGQPTALKVQYIVRWANPLN